MLKSSILIPAYNPEPVLIDLVRALLAAHCRVVVVNDGSDLRSKAVFEALDPAVIVLHHVTNLGKGAALKTGLHYIALNFPASEGVITADADAQHTVPDILNVAQTLEKYPKALILGVRSFDSKEVPFRSRFGNALTRVLFNFLTGLRLKDTQTGLRGIPLNHIPHYLSITPNHYEFELDMLLKAKHYAISIVQVPIQSVYIDHNKSSHFNPLIDSMRIYFVLFRFVFASLLAALVDYGLFMLSYTYTHDILLSQYGARIVSGGLNYTINRRGVFAAKAHTIWVTLPRYVFLAAILGFCSFLVIDFLVRNHVPIGLAKPLAELGLFIVSFSIQRSFVFIHHPYTDI